MKVAIQKKYKTEAQHKEHEAREKAKQILKDKDIKKLSQTVKDELLIELCKMHNLI